jgi:hypothetical protein
MKNWIETNILSRGKIPARKCNKQWFIKNNFISEYNKILELTHFLDKENSSLAQRLWHIFHNHFNLNKCRNPSCQNTTKFWSFPVGYRETCSYKCAQQDPVTKEKIKKTNMEKYGAEHHFQLQIFLNKQKQTNLKKYGVENVSQVSSVSEKKKQTCLKNFGTDWYLKRTDLIQQNIFKKYGVINIQQYTPIKNQTIQTRRGNFYDSLITTHRLNNLAIPLFSKEEYMKGGLYNKYKFECIKCKKIFDDCLEDGDLPRCPSCFRGRSWFENEVYDYIKTLLSTDIIEKNCRNILNGKELDIFIPSKKIAIECDGLFWHSEIFGGKEKQYHIEKTNKCENKGIKLIHIFEDEWIEKKDIIKQKLKHILHQNLKSIYARNCYIKEITSKECSNFLNLYHVQGSDTSSIKLGAFWDNSLVAVMTFGNLRKCLGFKKIKNYYELYRFSTSKPVVGIASKMLKYFKNNYKPSKIITFSDIRWSSILDNFYEKIGFQFVKKTSPNYWYFKKKTWTKRYHRFSFRKSELSKKLLNFDPNLTEWENMKNNGFDRIWDCGNLKYEMIVN